MHEFTKRRRKAYKNPLGKECSICSPSLHPALELPVHVIPNLRKVSCSTRPASSSGLCITSQGAVQPRSRYIYLPEPHSQTVLPLQASESLHVIPKLFLCFCFKNFWASLFCHFIFFAVNTCHSQVLHSACSHNCGWALFSPILCPKNLFCKTEFPPAFKRHNFSFSGNNISVINQDQGSMVSSLFQDIYGDVSLPSLFFQRKGR
jgi:hypothetical protein